jgi:biopolymer transport protein ExbD
MSTRRSPAAALVRPAHVPRSAINITPLVDVVLVLLIIFMVVMPLAEKDLTVRIPETEQVQTTDEVPPNQIIVNVPRSGVFEINGEAIADERYVDTLKTRLGQRAPTDRVVFVTPADEAPYRRLVKAMEGARSAGATALGMTTEPPPATPTTPPAPTAPPATPTPAHVP